MLIYSGDVDSCVPTHGTESYFLRKLNLTVTDHWAPWRCENEGMSANLQPSSCASLGSILSRVQCHVKHHKVDRCGSVTVVCKKQSSLDRVCTVFDMRSTVRGAVGPRQCYVLQMATT